MNWNDYQQKRTNIVRDTRELKLRQAHRKHIVIEKHWTEIVTSTKEIISWLTHVNWNCDKHKWINIEIDTSEMKLPQHIELISWYTQVNWNTDKLKWTNIILHIKNWNFENLKWSHILINTSEMKLWQPLLKEYRYIPKRTENVTTTSELISW
jgi:hypothetical protein